jgi:hypothetical protein
VDAEAERDGVVVELGLFDAALGLPYVELVVRSRHPLVVLLEREEHGT